MPGDLGKATGQRGTARPLRAAADHKERAAHKPAEGPAEQPAERARRGGKQWGYANHSSAGTWKRSRPVQGRGGGADQCRDAEEEQTTSSQTEDARDAPSSVSRRKRFLQTILCKASGACEASRRQRVGVAPLLSGCLSGTDDWKGAFAER
uniref:Uncharacterized protein n=1 Tax=Knipowitschia caucasica TaxID=637954 RepID=A0AAV2K639_KNICA